MPVAIALKNVSKSFKKRVVRREYTTLKTEFIALLTGRRKEDPPATHIEVLKPLSLEIPAGATYGIIGRNGSGKSTLLKLITGIYSTSSGEVKVNGRISALLELGAGFHPDFTGRENIFINGIILGMSRADLKDRVNEIIQFAELGDYIDEPIRTYSSGMFMRLAFAVATHVDPEILIVDEILSVGDDHFQRKSMNKMLEFKKAGKTIVLVTHDLGLVRQWCDCAAWIDGGRIRLIGEPGHVVESYRAAVAQAEADARSGGSSPLDSPGLELPAVAAPKAPEYKGPCQVTRLRILNKDLAPATRVSPEDAVTIELSYENAATHAPAFRVGIEKDGLVLFGDTFTPGELQQGPGRVSLSLNRVGLGEGSYSIVASVDDGAAPSRAEFAVEGTDWGSGLLRPIRTWSQATPASNA